MPRKKNRFTIEDYAFVLLSQNSKTKHRLTTSGFESSTLNQRWQSNEFEKIETNNLLYRLPYELVLKICSIKVQLDQYEKKQWMILKKEQEKEKRESERRCKIDEYYSEQLCFSYRSESTDRYVPGQVVILTLYRLPAIGWRNDT